MREGVANAFQGGCAMSANRLLAVIALALALAGCSAKEATQQTPPNKAPAPGQTGALTPGNPPGGMPSSAGPDALRGVGTGTRPGGGTGALTPGAAPGGTLPQGTGR